MPRRLLRTEDGTENRLEPINGNSILPRTNFQGEKLVLANENSVGAKVQLRDAVRRRPCKLTHTHHEEQIESCPGTLWEEDPQSQKTPQGGREELSTQPWQLRTQSYCVE